MKNLFSILTALWVLSLAVSCTQELEVDPTPDEPEVVIDSGEISIEPSQLTVSSFSGTHSVTYSIVTEVEGAELEAPESSETWVNNFEVSEDGVISFNVDSNYEGERSSVVTLKYADAVATFTVTQRDTKVLMFSDLDNNFWTATACYFDKELTELWISKCQHTYQHNDGYTYITYAEFVEEYVAAYNSANTDQIDEEYVLSFEYGIFPVSGADYSSVTFQDMEFSIGHMEVTNGSGYVPGQIMSITKVDGACIYEELEDGTIEMTVYSYHNSLYTTVYSFVFEKDGDEILYRITNVEYTDATTQWIPNYNYYGNKDSFAYEINGYPTSEGYDTYVPFGYLQYRMKKTTRTAVSQERGLSS